VSGTVVLLLIAGTIIVVVVVIFVLVLPRRLVERDTKIDELTYEQQSSAINNVRTALLQLVVGLVALLGITVAWRQLQDSH
jgi:type IV secretory pathway VirB3-like protein